MNVTWTESFTRAENTGSSIAVSHVVYHANASYTQSAVWMVVAVMIRQSSISTFLLSLAAKVNNSTRSFILERNSGVLVAAWSGNQIVVENGNQRPVMGIHSTMSLIKAISQTIFVANSTWNVTETQYFIYDGNILYSWRVSAYVNTKGIDWLLVVVTEQPTFASKVLQSGVWAIVIAVIAVTGSSIALCLISQCITQSLGHVCKNLVQLSKLQLPESPQKRTTSALYEIRMIYKTIQILQRGLTFFQKYIPIELLRQILSQQESMPLLDMETRNMSIMFVDVANFTNLVEQLEPKQLLQVLKDYFDCISMNGQRNNGTVDKFIGDAVCFCIVCLHVF